MTFAPEYQCQSSISTKDAIDNAIVTERRLHLIRHTNLQMEVDIARLELIAINVGSIGFASNGCCLD